MNGGVHELCRCLNTLECFEDSFTLPLEVRMAYVKYMHQLISQQRIFEGSSETCYQLGRDIADESYGIYVNNLEIVE